jgi:hypothetical protein
MWKKISKFSKFLKIENEFSKTENEIAKLKVNFQNLK